MKPLSDPGAGSTADQSPAPAAVLSLADPPLPLATLRHRPDFLKAAQARRQGTGGFLLQARDRRDASPETRIGFTASKKIGNAVARNRAKRRLRALARDILPLHALPGWDYVIVAKPGATNARAYADLMADLTSALHSVHRARP